MWATWLPPWVQPTMHLGTRRQWPAAPVPPDWLLYTDKRHWAVKRQQRSKEATVRQELFPLSEMQVRVREGQKGGRNRMKSNTN